MQIRYSNYIQHPMPISSEIFEQIQNNLEKEDCSICLDSLTKMSIAALKCCHLFHTECITSWFNAQKGNKSCPVCRQNTSNIIILKDSTKEYVLRKLNILLRFAAVIAKIAIKIFLLIASFAFFLITRMACDICLFQMHPLYRATMIIGGVVGTAASLAGVFLIS